MIAGKHCCKHPPTYASMCCSDMVLLIYSFKYFLAVPQCHTILISETAKSIRVLSLLLTWKATHLVQVTETLVQLCPWTESCSDLNSCCGSLILSVQTCILAYLNGGTLACERQHHLHRVWKSFRILPNEQLTKQRQKLKRRRRRLHVPVLRESTNGLHGIT